MSLAEHVSARVAYKAYVSGNMTSNSEDQNPGVTGAQELRRVTSTLTLNKDTYQSNEVSQHRQVQDYRHGKRMVSGEITGELSPSTYWDFFEAACRGTESAAISKSQAEFTSMAADNSTSKFTVGGSTWAAEGFRVGDIIRFTTLSDTDNNSKNFQIYSLSGVDAFVTPAPDTMGADTSFTVTRPGKKVYIPTSSSDFVRRKFAFEHYFSDVGIAQLFTECRINRVAVAMPATGLCTISVGVAGRNQVISDGSLAPYFSNPTASTTTGITAAVNGNVVYEGTSVGVITGLDFALDMAVTADAVVGQDFVPEIFLGRGIVTGTFTALLEDATYLDAFSNESEVELLTYMTTTSANDSPFFGVTMPRVKLGGANLPLQGEAGLTISCPFQALLLPSTTGYDQSTIVFVDSES